MIAPDNIGISSLTSTSELSPVNEDIFKCEFPLMTTPSNGTFSPGLTIMTSLIFTSSGLIILPFSSKAYSGFISSKLEIDFRLLFIALSSKIFPNSYKIITIKPSNLSPIK